MSECEECQSYKSTITMFKVIVLILFLTGMCVMYWAEDIQNKVCPTVEFNDEPVYDLKKQLMQYIIAENQKYTCNALNMIIDMRKLIGVMWMYQPYYTRHVISQLMEKIK